MTRKLTKSQNLILNRLQIVLKEHNIRLTPTRLDVLSAIITQQHPTMNEIIASLEKHNDKVNIMSVYNTIDLLLEKHIIYANVFNGKQITYEPRVQESYHMKCDNCQRIEHLHDLNHFGNMAKVIHETGQNLGWECDHFKIEIHGLCPNCQKQN